MNKISLGLVLSILLAVPTLQAQPLNCYGKKATYVFLKSKNSKSPSLLTACTSDLDICGDTIQLQDDTAPETGSETYIGLNSKNQDIIFELFEVSDLNGKNKEVYATITVGDSVVENQIDCQ